MFSGGAATTPGSDLFCTPSLNRASIAETLPRPVTLTVIPQMLLWLNSLTAASTSFARSPDQGCQNASCTPRRSAAVTSNADDCVGVVFVTGGGVDPAGCVRAAAAGVGDGISAGAGAVAVPAWQPVITRLITMIETRIRIRPIITYECRTPFQSKSAGRSGWRASSTTRWITSGVVRGSESGGRSSKRKNSAPPVSMLVWGEPPTRLHRKYIL